LGDAVSSLATSSKRNRCVILVFGATEGSDEREEYNGEKSDKHQHSEYCGADWSEVMPGTLIPSNEPKSQYAGDHG
jgi:hypothetical protein